MKGVHDRSRLLWIHGWLGDGGGRNVLSVGLERNVGAVPLPGYGRGGGVAGLPGAVSATVSRARRAGSVVLIGHSMGGMIAVSAARELGAIVKGLVLLAPVPPGGVHLDARGWELFSGAATDPALMAKVVDYLTAKRLPPAWVKRSVKRARELAPPDVLLRYLRDWVSPDQDSPRSTALELPVLLVLGRYDRAITPELAAREILPVLPRSETVVLEECGHFPLAELPLRTPRIVEDFLARLEVQ